MRLLRDDLIVVPARKDGDTNLVLDPLTGEELELGDVELFLVESVREPYSVSNLVAQLRDRFDLERSEDDLHEFLEMLDGHGLLSGATEEEEAQTRSRSPQALAGGDVAAVAAEDGNGDREGGHLFDPTSAFDTLARWLGPMRYLVKLIPAFALIGFFGLWFNFSEFGNDLSNVRAEFGLLGRLAFAALTVNLASQIYQGIVARYFGVRVPSFALGLAFGLLPRFHVAIKPGRDTSMRAKIAITATSLWVRLALFAFGSIIWVMTRSSGTLLPDTAAMLTALSAIGFLFSVNPLMKGDGYRLLCFYLEMPNLRERADSALKGMFRKRPAAIKRHAKDSLALRVYALASILFLTFLLSLVAFIAATRLEASFQGAGVVLFLVVAIYLVFHFRRGASAKPATKPASGGGAAVAPGAGGAAARRRDHRSGKRWISAGRVVRSLLLIGLLVCLFLPYRYETGGEAEILSMAARQIYAEEAGVIDEVFFSGGEWVAAGTVLAQMAQYRQSKDLRTTEAAIAEQRANIAQLETTPSQEEVDLAKEQLDTAQLQYEFSAARAARMKTLYEKGSISFDVYDETVEEMEVERQQTAERKANLAAVEEKVNPYELESARAGEQRLQEELAYHKEQLYRTALHMPIDGRIITMQLKDLENKYLDDGDLFAEVEDARQVRVKIAVPEADIGEVSVGDAVRLKLWAYPDRFFRGAVTQVYPATSQADYGTVVEVESLLDNNEGLLRSGMTGHAKIQGREMFVIQAFTRALVRFVLIEVWSWLP